MKIQRLSSGKDRGAILLACLVAAFIIGSLAVSALVLVQNENITTFRSQAWNQSMVVAEAGIEDGLALVNKYVGTSIPTSDWPRTAEDDGWDQVSADAYHVRRHLGTNADYYDVYVTNAPGNTPTITSTGTVVIWNGAARTTNRISRTVQVKTAYDPYAQNGPQVLTTINLSGGSYIDGYDSLDPSLSTDAQYDPNKVTANFNVTTIASNSVLNSKEITLSSSSYIHAHVNTGPNAGISLSGSANIGDTAWTGPGIEPGWTNDTVNLDKPPDVAAPTGVFWWGMPSVQKINNTNTYILSGSGLGLTNYYKIPTGFNLSGGSEILITNGPVTLIATNFQCSGGSTIVLASNSCVSFYVSGNNTTVSGGGVVNDSGSTANFNIFGLPDATKITLSGTSAFIGSVYAPEALLNLSGGSPFYGNFTVNSMDDSGGSAIHYDLALAGAKSAPSGYFVTLWQELLP